MSKSRKAAQATNWGDMKRVLVHVEADRNGERWYDDMEKAVDVLLKPHLRSRMSSRNDCEQVIRTRGCNEWIGICPPVTWLPDEPGHCPPQFVLCAPREWFRDDVPDYTGPVK